MKHRYLVSYEYNDKDHTFGCNTMEHVKEIIKTLKVKNVKVYDDQLKTIEFID